MRRAGRKPFHKARPVRFTLGPQEFIKAGISWFDPRDPYYFAVSLTWSRFFLLFLVCGIVINAFFAALYTLQPGSVANQPWPGFLSNFFFSLETLATVGYGEMYPATLYGHIVSACEIATGIIFTAIVTGLLFVRFSRAKSGIVYATNPVVTRHDGKRSLMLRIGNTRPNPLFDVETGLYVLVASVTVEGRQQVNVQELALQRRHFPVLAILWTAIHVIGEGDYLSEALADPERCGKLRFFFTVKARDPVTGQAMSDLHAFNGSDIRFDMHYVDAIRVEDDKRIHADYGLLSEVEADGPPAPA